jgi:hypothetical protein
MMPQLFEIGVRLTRQRALSAMPDAPVIPEVVHRRSRLRLTTARAFRRMADRLDT